VIALARGQIGGNAELLAASIRVYERTVGLAQENYKRWLVRRGLAQVSGVLDALADAMGNEARQLGQAGGLCQAGVQQKLIEIAGHAERLATSAESAVRTRPRWLDRFAGTDRVETVARSFGRVANEARALAYESRRASMRLVDPGDRTAALVHTLTAEEAAGIDEVDDEGSAFVQKCLAAVTGLSRDGQTA
jgi:hypothetical protein